MALNYQHVLTRQSTGLEIVIFRVVAASAPASQSTSVTDAANKAALPDHFPAGFVWKPSTGVFNFALRQNSAGRNIEVLGISSLTASRVAHASNLSTTGFTINTANLSGVAADADFIVTIARFQRKGNY